MFQMIKNEVTQLSNQYALNPTAAASTQGAYLCIYHLFYKFLL